MIDHLAEHCTFSHTEMQVQSSTVSTCFVLEKDTLSALFLSNQLNNEYEVGVSPWGCLFGIIALWWKLHLKKMKFFNIIIILVMTMVIILIMVTMIIHVVAIMVKFVTMIIIILITMMMMIILISMF